MKNKVLFINITKECNVNCPECYLSETSRKEKAIIPLEYVLKALSDPHLDNEATEVTLIWEGGELSLVGEEILETYLKAVKEQFPKVIQRLVTNAYSLPNWLIRLNKEYMDSFFDVTYAGGKKMSLDGSEEKYQERFMRNIKKAHDAGLFVVVNVETNKQTIERGTQALVDSILESGVKTWEFDTSVAFSEFFKAPNFHKLGYPIVQGTSNYKNHANFLIELHREHHKELEAFGFKSSIFEQALPSYELPPRVFNVASSQDYFTISPNGDLTTNVLFTDVPTQVLGNMADINISDVLKHPIRTNVCRYEVSRLRACQHCEFFTKCQGSASHVLVDDGSGECVGLKSLYEYMAAYENEKNAQQTKSNVA